MFFIQTNPALDADGFVCLSFSVLVANELADKVEELERLAHVRNIAVCDSLDTPGCKVLRIECTPFAKESPMVFAIESILGGNSAW